MTIILGNSVSCDVLTSGILKAQTGKFTTLEVNGESLKNVATSGDYNDLDNKPSIDDVVTEDSENLVKSGGVFTAIANATGGTNYAPISSPTFTGTVTAPVLNSTSIQLNGSDVATSIAANTSALLNKVNKAGDTFTGSVTITSNTGGAAGLTLTGGDVSVSGDITASGNYTSEYGEVELTHGHLTLTGGDFTIGGSKFINSGMLGIGTNSPSYKLEVNGDCKITSDLIVNTDTTFKQRTFIGSTNTHSLNQIQFRNTTEGATKSTSIGRISFWNATNETNSLAIYGAHKDNDWRLYFRVGGQNGAYLRKTGTSSNTQMHAHGYQTISDDRLKHNETLITNACDTIKKLRPVNYDRSAEIDSPVGESEKDTGFVAQEVEQIDELRHAVAVPEEEDEHYHLNYTPLFTYNVAATKELIARIEALEARIADLQ